MTATSNSWSSKQLCYIFLASLVIFTILRWDANAWLSRQLDAMLVQNNISMQYQSLSLHGSSIELSNIKLSIPNLPNQLLLDTIETSLDWSALWHGRIALMLTAKNTFIQFKTSLSLDDKDLIVNHLNAEIDIKPAQSWLGQSSLLQASGQAALQGSLQVDMQTGIPSPINLQMLWLHASINLLDKQYELGDYSVQLNDQSWLLQGGEALQLNGKGSLVMSTAPMFQWPLEGAIQIYSKENNAITAMLPSNNVDMGFTGTLGSPHWIFH